MERLPGTTTSAILLFLKINKRQGTEYNGGKMQSAAGLSRKDTGFTSDRTLFNAC